MQAHLLGHGPIFKSLVSDNFHLYTFCSVFQNGIHYIRLGVDGDSSDSGFGRPITSLEERQSSRGQAPHGEQVWMSN